MFALLAAVILAQQPKSNPVVDAFQKLSETGLSSATAPAKSPTAFSPASGRVYLSSFVKETFDTADEQAAMQPILTQLLDNYDVEAKKGGFANDSCAAMAFAMTTLFSMAKNQPLDDTAIATLTKQLRATFDVPGVRNATDKQKQEASEWAICASGYVLALGMMAESDEAKANIAKLAGGQLTLMTGATIDQFSVESGKLAIKPKKPANSSGATNTAGGLAPGFAFSPPAGWTKEGVWHILREKPDVNSGTTSALVRFLPAVPMKGSFSEILRSLWKQAIPEEFADSASALIFRRYVGNGAIAHFIFGRAVEKGQRITTLFTLYLVDCATHWQPVVVAQTYEDPTFNITSAVQMSANFSYPKSADMAETLLRTIKSPAKPFQTIADKASIVGAYHYGSSANQQWVNVYTGSTSMTFISYGGDLNLKADGTFDYSFVSASGAVGATNFRSAKGKGTWTVARDELICTFTQYDQGDGHKVKEHRYRIAGVVQFADGAKICVLKSGLSDPVNPTTVTDGSEYFTTKKKS